MKQENKTTTKNKTEIKCKYLNNMNCPLNVQCLSNYIMY